MPKISAHSKIAIFYDAQCPVCRKDRRYYEGLSQDPAHTVNWLDANDESSDLALKGINAKQALLELFIEVEDEQGQITLYSEIDAYIILMHRTTLLRPLSFIIALPIVRPMLSMIYRRWVKYRLKKQGRILSP